jgi:hypothetical protein
MYNDIFFKKNRDMLGWRADLENSLVQYRPTSNRVAVTLLNRSHLRLVCYF